MHSPIRGGAETLRHEADLILRISNGLRPLRRSFLVVPHTLDDDSRRLGISRWDPLDPTNSATELASTRRQLLLIFCSIELPEFLKILMLLCMEGGYQSGMIDKHGFGAKYHPWADRFRQLDDEIPAAQAELDVMKISQLSEEEIILGAKDLYERWPKLPDEEKRHIIEAITEKIIVGKDEVEINLYYAPPAPPSGHSGGSPNKSGGSVPPNTPSNRGKRAMNAQRFIGVMSHWSEYFMQGADLPVIGASAVELKSIAVPTCIIPGNDRTRLREVGENLHRIMTGSELHILFPEHVDVDLVPPEEWNTKEAEQAAIFVDFLKRLHALPR